MYSDSDSLSFNSLSRSSSLIQFESLERQLLLNDTQYSGSTPTVGVTAGVLAPDATLADDAKINLFRKTQNLLAVNGVAAKALAPLSSVQQPAARDGHCEQISDSDTYSSVESTSSSYSSEESYYLNHSDKNSLEEEDEEEEEEEEGTTQQHHQQSVDKRQAFKNKNSVESLSEDSGYCDQSLSALKTKSKSNPNLAASLDWPGSYYHQFEPGRIESSSIEYSDAARSMEDLSRLLQQQQTHNMARKKTITQAVAATESQRTRTTQIVEEQAAVVTVPPCAAAKNRSGNLENEKKDRSPLERCASITKRVLSNSSPDLLIEHIYQNQLSGGQISRKQLYQLYSKYLHQQTHGGAVSGSHTDSKATDQDDFCVVSSVPDDLNLCCEQGEQQRRQQQRNESNFWQTADTRNSYANKDVNLFDLKTEHRPIFGGGGGVGGGSSSSGSGGGCFLSPNQPSSIHTNYSLTASYANLTLLNYSDENLSPMAHNFPPNGMAVPGKYQSNDDTNKKYSLSTSPTESAAFRSEFSSLLDEITAHFDRNLSILNDQDEDYDPFYQ